MNFPSVNHQRNRFAHRIRCVASALHLQTHTSGKLFIAAPTQPDKIETVQHFPPLPFLNFPPPLTNPSQQQAAAAAQQQALSPPVHPLQFQLINPHLQQQGVNQSQVTPVTHAVAQSTNIQIQPTSPASIYTHTSGLHPASTSSTPPASNGSSISTVLSKPNNTTSAVVATMNSLNHNSNNNNSHNPGGATGTVALPTTGRHDDSKIRDKCLYLKQLLQDKKQIQGLAGCFLHVDRILDEGKILLCITLLLSLQAKHVLLNPLTTSGSHVTR